MNTIWSSPTSATVSGLGTTAKPFGLTMPVSGSNHFNNNVFNVHASGSVDQEGSNGSVLFTLSAVYPSTYPTTSITHIASDGSHATLTVPYSSYKVGQSITVAGTLQKDIATITNVALTSNVVTVTAANDFAVGDSCVVVAVTNTAINGTFVLTGANSSTFTYALTHGDIVTGADTGSASVPSKANGTKVITAVANGGLSTSTVAYVSTSTVTTHSEVGTVAIASQPVFITTSQAVAGKAPWSLDVAMQMDSASGLMQGAGTSLINNLLQARVALSNAIVGINPALEPPISFTLSATFDTTSANNTATLSVFRLEA